MEQDLLRSAPRRIPNFQVQRMRLGLGLKRDLSRDRRYANGSLPMRAYDRERLEREREIWKFCKLVVLAVFLTLSFGWLVTL
jgi:hypothetical protein